MPDWYFLSLAALVLLGTQRFFYKVAVERNCSSPLTTAVFMATVTLLSVAAFLLSGDAVGDIPTLLLLAAINSTAFALGTVVNMEALRRLPTAITFPLTRLSILLVIGFSILYFGERPGPWQWLGILLGLAVVVVLAADLGGTAAVRQQRGTGLLLVAACVLCGAVASISSKFAAVATSKTAFMALSYLLGTIFSLAMARTWKRDESAPRTGAVLGIGVLMGLFNFAGFYAFLAALERGPLSLIALITGMHFVIPVALSVLFYREKITPRRWLGIGLTLLAVLAIQY
ncbi:MAG: DMT family transporter [Trichloromonadaceae bacterium]